MKNEKPSNRKQALVHVLGCKVNQAEAGAMVGILESLGYTVTDGSSAPDLIVVNTCCVTARAEGKSRRAVKRLAEKYPDAELVVTGCLAEVNPSSLVKLSESCHVLGTVEKDHFGEFVETLHHRPEPIACHGARNAKTFGDLRSAPMPGRARAFLKIQDGCSQWCSYCIVPRARGPSRSLHPETVFEYARAMEDEGVAEIVLTGIHLGAYGHELDPRFPLDLLVERLAQVCHKTRFRLSSIEPQEITPKLIELAASHPRVCRHFHLPLQSADDVILQHMKRPYSAAVVADILERIFLADPDVCVGMDVLVGFPGEDEESFEKTKEFVRNSGAAYLHVFPFSPRPGTPAATFKHGVPHNVAQQRVEELRSISLTLRKTFYSRFVGKTLPAVIEPASEDDTLSVIARTDNYIPVRIAAATAPDPTMEFHVRVDSVERDVVTGTSQQLSAGPGECV